MLGVATRNSFEHNRRNKALLPGTTFTLNKSVMSAKSSKAVTPVNSGKPVNAAKGEYKPYTNGGKLGRKALTENNSNHKSGSDKENTPPAPIQKQTSVQPSRPASKTTPVEASIAKSGPRSRRQTPPTGVPIAKRSVSLHRQIAITGPFANVSHDPVPYPKDVKSKSPFQAPSKPVPAQKDDKPPQPPKDVNPDVPDHSSEKENIHPDDPRWAAANGFPGVFARILYRPVRSNETASTTAQVSADSVTILIPATQAGETASTQSQTTHAEISADDVKKSGEDVKEALQPGDSDTNTDEKIPELESATPVKEESAIVIPTATISSEEPKLVRPVKISDLDNDNNEKKSSAAISSIQEPKLVRPVKSSDLDNDNNNNDDKNSSAAIASTETKNAPALGDDKAATSPIEGVDSNTQTSMPRPPQSPKRQREKEEPSDNESKTKKVTHALLYFELDKQANFVVAAAPALSQ
ncbi:hypothetical protein HDV00_003199 [Rhizophlyctis rosea]|nr:hypothetical protein HDV00_003199 [Rhizophlyctis rosea]